MSEPPLTFSSVCIISIVRIFQVLEYSLADVTYNDVNFAIWSGIELAIATLSTCVPTMRPLLDRAFGRRSNSTFTPSSFLHTSFLHNISIRNAPGERERPNSQSASGARQPRFWRLGREESLSTQNEMHDKSQSTITVDEKEERGSEAQATLSESDWQMDGRTEKKEWDVNCCERQACGIEAWDSRSCDGLSSGSGSEQSTNVREKG